MYSHVTYKYLHPLFDHFDTQSYLSGISFGRVQIIRLFYVIDKIRVKINLNIPKCEVTNPFTLNETKNWLR